MANNYETITVLTDIPEASLTPLHQALLEALGFDIEDGGDGTLYVYTEDSNCMPDLDEVEDIYGRSLSDEERELPMVVAALDDGGEGWVAVLQDALNTDPMRDIQHIDVQASQTCSKARPGEHGGWSMRIERDRTRFMSTQDAFREWDGETQHVKDLEFLCNIAARSQRSADEEAAFARVSDSIAHHPLVEYGEEA